MSRSVSVLYFLFISGLFTNRFASLICSIERVLLKVVKQYDYGKVFTDKECKSTRFIHKPIPEKMKMEK